MLPYGLILDFVFSDSALQAWDNNSQQVRSCACCIESLRCFVQLAEAHPQLARVQQLQDFPNPYPAFISHKTL